MAASNSNNYSSSCPCAACKFLRRKCLPDCIFAPYFPPEEPHKFANVHKIFGASNVSKLLNEVQPHQREDAVNSLAYEAEARLKDPVYGCVGAISVLQRQLIRLQKELDATNAHLFHYAYSTGTTATAATAGTTSTSTLAPPGPPPPSSYASFNYNDHHHRRHRQGYYGNNYQSFNYNNSTNTNNEADNCGGDGHF